MCSEEAEALAKKLKVRFYRASVKEDLNVSEGRRCRGEGGRVLPLLPGLRPAGTYYTRPVLTHPCVLVATLFIVHALNTAKMT